MYLVEVDNSQDNSSLWAEVTTETSQVKIKDTNGETSYDSPSNQKKYKFKRKHNRCYCNSKKMEQGKKKNT